MFHFADTNFRWIDDAFMDCKRNEYIDLVYLHYIQDFTFIIYDQTYLTILILLDGHLSTYIKAGPIILSTENRAAFFLDWNHFVLV